MTVDTAAVVARRPTALARVGAVPSRLVLGGLIGLSFVLRLVVAQRHTSPRLLPDEYIYSTLARSLSHGELAIRGQPAHFPAFLEPLLAAPLWMIGGNDVELIYRLTQGMHAFVVSLVAIPVYVLARRIGAGEWTAVACSAFSLALPALVYSSFITADAVALTLAIGAVAAGTAALDRPAARAQVTFLVLAGLATLSRIQYVVLPLAFLAAALVVERGRLRRTVASYRVLLVLTLVPVIAALAVGPKRILGYYSAVTSLHFDPLAIGHWILTDAFLLTYAAGWVLIPVALIGLVLGVIRPQSRAELAFTALVASLAGFLLLEAAVYAANGSDRFQERYLLALLPLVPVLFVVGARRLDDRRSILVAASLSAGLFVLAAAVPLAPYTVLFSKQDSPTLQAVYRLEQALGYGGGSLAVGIAAGGLALIAAACAWRPRLGTPTLLAVAIGVLAVATVADSQYDSDLSRAAFRTFGGAGLVDGRQFGDVSVLETPYSSRTQISAQLFWNASLTRILKMRDSPEVDAFGSTPVNVAPDGRIRAAGGRFVSAPLLVEEYASWATFDGAVLVHRTVDTSLWRPDGTPRLSMLVIGRYFDGWLGSFSDVTVWPRADGPRRGTLRLAFSLPAGMPATTLDLRGPGVRRAVRVAAGSPTVLDLPAVVRRPWRIHIRTRRPFLVDGGRLVSVHAKVPLFIERS